MPEPADPTWRRLVPSPTDNAPAEEGRPLALGVELRQLTSRADAHWGPRRLEGVTPRELARRSDDVALCVRPLERGTKNTWVKGAASWDAVRRAPDRYDREQARWFGELHGIAHDARATGPFRSVAEWLVLDHVESRLLWPHLIGAASLGIPLVATSRGQVVTLTTEGSVTAEVSPTDDGGVHLGIHVVLDGAPVDAAHVRRIGRSGLYAFTVDRSPTPLVLAPVAVPEAVLPLLAAPEGITVSAEEREAFFREAYPHLARRVDVRAAGGVVLPDPRGPSLRVTVAFAGEGARYRLEWSYPGLGIFDYEGATSPERDDASESELKDRVEEAWEASSTLPFAPAAALEGDDAGEFAVRILPALEGLENLRVEVSGDRPRPVEWQGDPAITVTTVESSDPDWFGLGILVSIDGRPIPFGALLTALGRGRKRMRLSDGAWFSLAHPALARLKELLEESAALEEWETGPRIHRTQTSLWADFEDLADIAEPAVRWRAIVAGLRDEGDVGPTPLPEGLRAELRAYQRAGFDWLAFLWKHGLGGILADDMGLGKTLQALALIAHARVAADRPFLVVAPTSVLSAWREQAERFTPELAVAVRDETRGRAGVPLTSVAASADLVLTSYAVLRLDEDEYADLEWAGVVLDEAQFVKNPATRVHQAVRRLRAPTTIAITGTPVENGLADLWALLALTAPGLFPSARRFREEYVQPIEKGKVPENAEGGEYRAARLARLRRRIRPLVLRRTKELVAGDLPPKQEQDLRVELTPGHRAVYDSILHRERQKVLGLLDDLDQNRFIVFRSLTLLRMTALAPALVDERHTRIGSSKLDSLVDHVTELAAEGHRALVFSQFTTFLDLVGERLDAAGIAFARLDGSTPRRGEVVNRFRAGDAPVFLISLKAGGFGLTLTEADYVFVMDPWWSPAAEEQAIDRAHRIGQARSVFVYRLIAADTIEEKVRALQRRKARLSRAVLDDDDLLAQNLTADDVRSLLEP